MVRDEITDGKGSRWLQPMMKALGLDPADQGKLRKDPAVALMPDWVGRKRELHFLLNFPVDIDTECVEKKIGKKALWDKQMNTAWEDSKIKQRFHLLWDGMTTTAKQKPDAPWWKRKDVLRDGVVSLSIDMGQRRAADYALLHSLPHKEPDSFVKLGEQGGHEWYARIWNYTSPTDPTIKVAGVGSLKLPGEDAEVFIDGKKAQEPFGRKGRLSDPEDYDEAIALARRLLHSDEKGENWLGTSKESYSVPEQNDKLVRLFLGALSRYRTWFRWSWQLTPEHYGRWERVFKKEIAKVWYFDAWKEIAEQSVTPANAAALQGLVAAETEKLRKLLVESLIQIANRVVPLRDNQWRWVNLAPGENEKPLHQLAADGPKPDKKPKSRGQRGLSLARLEQLEDFRRSILSLNRLLRHAIGVKPDFGAATFGTRLPDPCAVLTDKIVRMKEERVNQTAHMILALALGVQLKAPGDDKQHREEHDIHGEYEPIPGRKPVDFIVLEDLSRYTTDKSRARSENSRLMKWCHRAINEKIKMLAEPFGLPVVEVFASHTSRFDGRTGGAGFRAAEVGATDRDYWTKSIEKEPNSAMAEVFAQLDALEAAGVKNARLMIPQAGGEFFIEAKPNTNAHDPATLPKVRQADINAAVNIGLRAIAGPHCLHAHPRVRIEKAATKGGAVQTWQTKAKGNKREQVQFGKVHEVIVNLSEESKLAKDATATLMYDKNKIARYGQATIRGYQHEALAHNAAIFSRQKNEKGEHTGAVARLEWKICKHINSARLRKWGIEPPMIWQEAANPDPDDEIPMT
jgi:IS605 OrfB family transposase